MSNNLDEFHKKSKSKISIDDYNSPNKSSRLIWKCVKNIYISFASAVKNNIFIHNKEIDNSHNPKQKLTSSKYRLIDKNLNNKKYHDRILSKPSMLLKKKKHSISHKFMNKNISNTIRNIENKQSNNRKLYQINKSKGHGKETENNEFINSYYDHLDDIKNLFSCDDYEKKKHFYGNSSNNKEGIKKKYQNLKNIYKKKIGIYNKKPSDGINATYSESSGSVEYNSNKLNSDDNDLSYDYMIRSLKRKGELHSLKPTERLHNLTSRDNKQHDLRNLYNADIKHKDCFFFQSSGDESMIKNQNSYFINEKKKKKEKKKNGNSSGNCSSNSYERSDSGSNISNKQKTGYSMYDKCNTLQPKLRNNDQTCNQGVSIYSTSKKIDDIYAKSNKEKNKNYENLYYGNIFQKEKIEKPAIDIIDKSPQNLKNALNNKKNEDEEMINILVDEKKCSNDYEFSDNNDITKNEEDKNFKNNDHRVSVIGNTENYNNFIKHNEEIKSMRNIYKSLIQLVDTFIDESLNENCISSSLMDIKHTNTNYKERQSDIGKNACTNDNIMNTTGEIDTEKKNKYIVLKYDEDSLIEALEKLRIDKKKKKEIDHEREKEKEKEEKEKKKKKIIIKIDKNVFYKCTTKDQYETAMCILNQKTENKVLIEKFNVPLLYSQIKCLINTRWLNDEIINFYLSMIQEYNEKSVKNDSLYFPKIFTFSTFFFQSLSLNGRYNYSNISRWTKKKKVDIFSFDLILIPLHVGGNHWTLGSISIKDKQIKVYDSLSMPNKKFFEYIKRYIADESKDKKQIELNSSMWGCDKDGLSEKGIPCQENGYDCGVFTCMFAKCLSFNREFDFFQKDIKDIRLKMVYEISQGCLSF